MPLCPTCQNLREVGYGLDCVPGDQAVFIRTDDTRPHYKNKCSEYCREAVPGSAAALIERVTNTAKGQRALAVEMSG